MSVEYDTSTTTSSVMTDVLSANESKICGNHVSPKKCHGSYHYVCLGALSELVQLRVRRRHVQDKNFIFIGIKYIQNLYKRIHQYIYGELYKDEFLRSLIASIGLFALGMKLTNELAAWKV